MVVLKAWLLFLYVKVCEEALKDTFDVVERAVGENQEKYYRVLLLITRHQQGPGQKPSVGTPNRAVQLPTQRNVGQWWG